MPLPSLLFLWVPQTLLSVFTKFVLWGEALHPGVVKHVITFILPYCNECVKVTIVITAVLESMQIIVRAGLWCLVNKQSAVFWLTTHLPPTITLLKSLIAQWWPFLLDLEWWKAVLNHLWW